MRRTFRLGVFLLWLATLVAAALSLAAPAFAVDGSVPVTPDNFPRAESDLRFSIAVKNGAFGKFLHPRKPPALDRQTVPKAERDVLTSTAVFDLDAGPVTIALPDPGKRYLSLQIIDEDGYTDEVDYGAGTHVLSKDRLGTRYALAALRIAANPDDPQDLAAANALQDAVKADQPNGPGAFQTPNWDAPSQVDVRTGLRVLADTLRDAKGMSGARGKVDPVRRLIGSAVAWGAPPETDMLALDRTPPDNDGGAVYRLELKDVPVDGFWSVSVYNDRGFFTPNARNAYSLTSATAKPNPDGSFSLQFGGCGDATRNCLPTPANWRLAVRLYRPKPEAASGAWTFPQLALVPQPPAPPLPPPQTVKAAPPVQGAAGAATAQPETKGQPTSAKGAAKPPRNRKVNRP